jgi:hypothetical protein
MNEENKPICCGGVHCLKLKDKKHSTQFIHLNPVNFSFSLSLPHTQSIHSLSFYTHKQTHKQRNFSESIEQCEISKNPTLILFLKRNSNEIEIPNSISTLRHLDTLKLFGNGREVNVNPITSLHNQIQTCVVGWLKWTPTLNDKSNPIYTLTKLQHLELMIGCEINELNETISNLTSNSFVILQL